MSVDQRYKKIHDSDNFKELVKKRNNFSWMLSIVMLLAYYSFILIVAFYPEFFGKPVSEGSVTTYGIPIGLFIIILSFVLTGIYVFKTNREFDELTKKIIEESA